MIVSLGGGVLTAGALVAGKYRLIKPLGEGAMGVVWSAVNAATNGEVALKLILRSEPELRQRLIREGQACGTIRHRNVVQVHDVGQTDAGDPFLVMELLQGETLGELLARKRRLSPQETASVGRDVARALAAAHDKGIVHRDLKPANIFLHNEPGGDAPVVKVLDFGVSKNFLQSDGLRTVAGGAVGSPMYMSPEQARADREIDGRADMWSLGVVLYEMLTGERPFNGETSEVLAGISGGDIPRVARRIRRIDPDLDAIVAGCLTRDRATRLGPAAEVARRLENHAAPGARAPLPSLMEIGPSELAEAAAISASGGAAFSPGHGGTALRPSSSGYGGTALRPSSSGHGGTALRPSSSGHGGTAPGSTGDGEDESTRRIDPSMLAPQKPQHGAMAGAPVRGTPQPAPLQVDPFHAGSGTIPISDPQPEPWNSPPAAGPKGTMLMAPEVAQQAQAYAQAQMQMQAQMQVQAHEPAMPQGDFNQTAPMPQIPIGALKPNPPRSTRPIVAAIAVVIVSAIGALAVVWLRRPTSPEPAPIGTSLTAEATQTPAPAVPPPASAPVGNPAPVVTTVPEVPSTPATATAVASAVPSTPQPPKTAAAPTPKPSARPSATTKAAPACTSKFPGVKCTAAPPGVANPWPAKKPTSKDPSGL